MTDAHFIVLSGLLLFTVMATMFSRDLDDDRVIWLWSGMTLAVLHFARIQFAELVFKQTVVFWSGQQVDSAGLVR